MKVGVIGAGKISGIYLENMINRFDNLEVVGIASEKGAEEKAKEYGIRAYKVQEMLDDPEIEMVVNLTPPFAHYDVTKKALLAGKHVYSEKTLTDDLPKAKELLELADEKGLYLGCAPDTFLGSGFQTARAIIDQGVIGEINSFAIAANRNTDLLLFFAPAFRKPGVGIMYDFCVYYITALVSLLGPVSRVGGVVRRPYLQHKAILPGPEYGQMLDSPNETITSAVIELENGVTGTFHIDTESNAHEDVFFTVYGTKGVLYCSDPNTFGGDIRVRLQTLLSEAPEDAIHVRPVSPYQENCRGIGPAEMAEAIEEGRKNRTSKEMAYHVMDVLNTFFKTEPRGSFVDVESTCQRPAPMTKKVDIKNIGHVALLVEHDQEMRDFYTKVLGMEPAFRLDNDIPGMTVKKPEYPPFYIEYMKFADGQFLELLHNNVEELTQLENKGDYYGITKMSFEVEDVEKYRDTIVAAGAVLNEDVHTQIDGTLAISVIDPDGNEAKFLQYPKDGSCLYLPDADDKKSLGELHYNARVTLVVKDQVNVRNFYCAGLGMKLAATITRGDFSEFLEKNGGDPGFINGLRVISSRPLADYIEVAPHQYLELIYDMGEKKVLEEGT